MVSKVCQRQQNRNTACHLHVETNERTNKLTQTEQTGGQRQGVERRAEWAKWVVEKCYR